MYYGKKKAITITIIVLVIIALLGGTFAYLFLATDMFKPNEELFYKYLGQALADTKFTKNIQLSNISSLKEEMPYTVDGELTIEATNVDNSKKYEDLNKAKLTISSKFDNEKKKGYAISNLYLDKSTVFTAEYANNGDIYAINAPDIANAYIGIENKNLQSLLQKLGVKVNNGESTIQNKINLVNYEDLLELTENEKEHIYQNYASVIKENIPKESYTREKDITVLRDGVTYKTTGYRVNLNGNQLKELEIALLNTLKQDSITLNLISTKAKTLGLDENYTQVNNLSKSIDGIINQIKNQNSQMNDVSIVIYVANGKVITTEIIVKNNVKFTLYTTKLDNTITRNIIVDNLGENNFEKLIFKFVENKTTEKSTYNFSLNVNNEKQYSVSIENTGSAIEEKLDTKINVIIEDEKDTFEINYTQNMKFIEEIKDFFELSRNNCAVLNDYTAEQVQALVGSLYNRIVDVFKEKAAMFGVSIGGYSVQPEINKTTVTQNKIDGGN